jgi:1-aminocyclopropane-1-carboxylate deaminase/D-cysteine desulfhydrase-like pyridoxal-dependent ACC family enzyme
MNSLYTKAKEITGLIDLIEEKEIEWNSTVLFWHAEDTPAIFADEKKRGLLS